MHDPATWPGRRNWPQRENGTNSGNTGATESRKISLPAFFYNIEVLIVPFLFYFETCIYCCPQISFCLTIYRIAHQAVENYNSLKEVVFIGIQPRGTYISQRMVPGYPGRVPERKDPVWSIDITFYRDDIRRGITSGE